VYHDIGPYSRDLLKIKNEKALRKAISKTYMHSYWNKQETKELTEDVLIGYIGNKIPVTPLLFTLQLNNDRKTKIKEDIDYSVTSESNADNSEEENIDEDTLLIPPFDNTMESKKSSKELHTGNFQVKKSASFSKSDNLTKNVNTKSSEDIKPSNFIIKEEVNCSGDEVNISITGRIPVSGSFQLNNYKMNPNGQGIKVYGQVLSNSPKRGTMKITNIQLPDEVVDQESPIQKENVARRESKTSIFSKIIHNANLKKERKFTRDSFLLKKFESKPPLLKTKSLKKENSVESAKNMNLSVDISLVSNGSGSKKAVNKSMNSSMNEIDYTNNFKNLVESIEADIKERLRLKIVPYSASKRKKLQNRIEKDISLLTKLMMSRKASFKPACTEEHFKKA
jgi:hypothetical protein